MLDGKEKKRIRGLAHFLKPTVHIGKEGVTEALLTEIERTARAAGTVKIRVLPNSFLTLDEAETSMTGKLPGEFVGRIGKILIYWQRPEEPEPVRKPSPRPTQAQAPASAPRKSTATRQAPPSSAAGSPRRGSKPGTGKRS